MTTQKQMLNDAVDKEPLMANEERGTKQSNTCIVIKWHLQKPPMEVKGETPRCPQGLKDSHVRQPKTNTKPLRSRRSRSVTNTLRSHDRRAAQVTDRVGRLAVQALQLSGFCQRLARLYHRIEVTATRSWSRGRFGTAVVALHDKCILCEAMKTTRVDAAVFTWREGAGSSETRA